MVGHRPSSRPLLCFSRLSRLSLLLALCIFHVKAADPDLNENYDNCNVTGYDVKYCGTEDATYQWDDKTKWPETVTGLLANHRIGIFTNLSYKPAASFHHSLLLVAPGGLKNPIALTANAYCFTVAVVDESGAEKAYRLNGAGDFNVEPDGKKSVVITVMEPSCVLRLKQPLTDPVRAYYVMPRATDYDLNVGGGSLKVPLFKFEEDVHKKARDYNYYNAYDSMKELDDKGKKIPPKECHDKCMFGRVIIYHMGFNQEFSMKIMLKPTCDWVKLVLRKRGNEWDPSFSAEMNIDNSWIVMPNELRASSLVFRNAEHNGSDIHIVYRNDDTDNKDDMRLRVMNLDHDTADGLKSIEHDRDIALMFSDVACLREAVTKLPLPFPPLPAKGATRYVYDEDGDEIKDEPATYPPPTDEVPVKDRNASKVNQTDGSTTTTPAPLDGENRTHPGPQPDQTEANAYNQWMKELADQQNAASGLWRIWAVAAGFAAGSALSFVIGGAILYALRRSLYVFWYREMYNRYGSETTAGGATTTGATVGSTMGGTTMGGTTGGTTMGSADTTSASTFHG